MCEHNTTRKESNLKSEESMKQFSPPKSGTASSVISRTKVDFGWSKLSSSREVTTPFGEWLRRVFPIAILALTLGSPAMAHPIDMDAIAQIESSNNPKAVGKSGEIGLYQISPIVLKHFNQSRKRLGGDDGATFVVDENVQAEDLKDPLVNEYIANWYMNWLFDRCWTVKDTIIAWNWGIGNWREWQRKPCVDKEGVSNLWKDGCFNSLPKVTQDYLKKYEKLTGDKL